MGKVVALVGIVLCFFSSLNALSLSHELASKEVKYSKKVLGYCGAPPLSQYPPFKVKALNTGKLEQVHVVMRHGDRAPVSFIKRPGLEKDATWECSKGKQGPISYNPDKQGHSTATFTKVSIPKSIPTYLPFASRLWKGSCLPGQLTTIGAQQQQALGESFRKIYVDKLSLLPSKLNTSKIYTRSTNYWRTMESAKSFLSGLYPAKSRSQNDVLQLEVYPELIENLVERQDCKPIGREFQGLKEKHPKLVAIREKMAPTLSKLTTIFNEPPATCPIIEFFDILQARICHGLPLPKLNNMTVSKDDVENIVDYMTEEIDVQFRTGGSNATRLSQMASSQFFKELFFRIEQKSNGVSETAFHLYSAHDITLTFLLGVLNAKEFLWPAYASHLVFEVWKVGKERYIRVLYNGHILKTLDSWCDLSQCKLDSFKHFLAPSLDFDHVNECMKN